VPATARCIPVAALLSLLAVSAASAQRAPARKGFWVGVGGGSGSLGQSCGGCTGRTTAGTAYLKLGGTLNERWRLGVETDTWVKVAGGTTVVAGNASLAAYYYPMPARGLFLRGGVGFAYYQEQHQTNAAIGLGLVGGVGYDLKIGAGFALTPFANLNWGSVGDVVRGLTTIRAVKQTLTQVGLGVTWH